MSGGGEGAPRPRSGTQAPPPPGPLPVENRYLNTVTWGQQGTCHPPLGTTPQSPQERTRPAGRQALGRSPPFPFPAPTRSSSVSPGPRRPRGGRSWGGPEGRGLRSPRPHARSARARGWEGSRRLGDGPTPARASAPGAPGAPGVRRPPAACPPGAMKKALQDGGKGDRGRPLRAGRSACRDPRSPTGSRRRRQDCPLPPKSPCAAAAPTPAPNTVTCCVHVGLSHREGPDGRITGCAALWVRLVPFALSLDPGGWDPGGWEQGHTRRRAPSLCAQAPGPKEATPL